MFFLEEMSKKQCSSKGENRREQSERVKEKNDQVIKLSRNFDNKFR